MEPKLTLPPPTFIPLQDADVVEVKFSEREIAVLRLIAEGLGNAAIGAKLFVSEDTIKSHIRRMMKRTGARDRTHLTVLAIKLGHLDQQFLQSLRIPVTVRT